MSFARCAAVLVLLGPPQEPGAPRVFVGHRDGHIVSGVLSISEFKIESSVGVTTVALKDLAKLYFEKDQVNAIGRDKSSLKGKLTLDEIKFQSLLGDLTFKRSDLTHLQVPHQVHPPIPEPQPPSGVPRIQVRTTDNSDLIGTVVLSSVRCETSIGKFDVPMYRIRSFKRDKERQTLSFIDGGLLVGQVKWPDLQIRTGLGLITVKPESIAELTYHGHKTPDPNKEPEQTPPAPPGPAKVAPLAPAAKMPLKSALGSIRITRDGTRMYAINYSESKLCRWRLPELVEDGSVQLTGVEKAVALDPEGTRVYAVGQKTISIVSTALLTLEKSFSVEVDIEDAIAIDKDTLLATGYGRGTVLVSISKTAVIEKFREGSARILVAQDEARAYVGECVFSIRRDPAGSPRVEETPIRGQLRTNVRLDQISPDGRYGCTRGDRYTVVRLGRCWAASHAEVAQVERHAAAAFSPNSTRLYLFTSDGFLKIYDVPGFKIQAAHNLGVRATQAFIHSNGKSITLAGAIEGAAPVRTLSGLPSEVVDLYRFEIPK